MIGTATAAIIGGLSAAGAIGGAKIASNASKKAAQQQVASADKAAAELRGERERFSTQYAPYADASRGAITQLSNSILLRGSKQPGNNVLPFRAGGAQPMAQMMPGRQQTAAPSGWTPRTAMPLQQAVQLSQGQLWSVQSPDGEVRQVPPDIGAQAIQRGATRVA